uniref:LIM zinc-binding domain-containing protein n=1 Tax=Arcella intermedia TaxID=1963864 RepID=A0A6B2LPH0_9EUKA
MSATCAGCGKTAYPNEQIKALDVTWHKTCLKCETCKTTLSLNNLQSFDKKPYCRSHVPTVKHTTVADDVMTKHAKETQEVNSYSVRTNIETQKGTGEKPTVTLDDQMMQFNKKAQEINSYSKKENIETQKGTGEKPNQEVIG